MTLPSASVVGSRETGGRGDMFDIGGRGACGDGHDLVARR
jgi:hypothetical protein